MRYEFTDVSLERDGKELYFNKVSCPASLPEKNLLLIHGLTYTNHIFDLNYKDYSFARFMAKNGYTIWRLDIGGYGKSHKVKDGFSVNTQSAAYDIAAAAAKIIELSGQEKIDVMGWSWGSMTTALFAAAHPEQINKLVWFGPCLGGVEGMEVKDPFASIDWPYAVRVFQHIDEETLDYDTVEPEVVGMWANQIWHYDARNLRPNGGCREIFSGAEKWLIKPETVKVPTLLITGDNDFYAKLDRCEKALKVLPEGSELVVMHGGSHSLMWEKDYYIPFREKVLSFIKG